MFSRSTPLEGYWPSLSIRGGCAAFASPLSACFRRLAISTSARQRCSSPFRRFSRNSASELMTSMVFSPVSLLSLCLEMTGRAA